MANPLERRENFGLEFKGGGQGKVESKKEFGNKTPLMWKDLPSAWVRKIRKERNGDARLASNGMSLFDTASEEDIERFLRIHPESAGAIEQRRKERDSAQFQRESEVYRAPEGGLPKILGVAEAPDFTPEEISVASHNNRKVELAKTIVPQPAKPLPTPEEISIAEHEARKLELAKTIIPQPAEPLPVEETVSESFSGNSDNEGVVSYIDMNTVEKNNSEPILEIVDKKDEEENKTPEIVSPVLDPESQVVKLDLENLPEEITSPKVITLEDLPPRVAEVLNQHVVLAGLFGGKQFAAKDVIPENALLWLEKRGSITKEQLKELGWVEVAQEQVKNPNESPEALVSEAESITELRSIVASINNIQGSKELFSGEEVSAIILLCSLGKLESNCITRTYGIREKFLELQQEKQINTVDQTPNSPQSPEQELTPEQKLENARVELESAREAFIPKHQAYRKGEREGGWLTRLKESLGIGKKADTAESEANIPEDLREVKERYEKAKLEYGRLFYVASKEEYKGKVENSFGTVEQIEALAESYARARTFNTVFLDEQALLQKSEAETWPPQNRSIFRKSLDWYRKRGRFSRALISTAIITGGAVAGGSVGVGAAAVFAGSRFIRVTAGVGVGWLAGKGFDKLFKADAASKKAEERISELRRVFGEGDLFDSAENFRATDRALRGIEGDQKISETRRAFAKALVMAGASFGTSSGLSKIDSLFNGANATATTSFAKPTPIIAPDAEVATGVGTAMADSDFEVTGTVEGNIPAITEEPMLSAEEEQGLIGDPIVEQKPFGELTVATTKGADNLWALIKNKLNESGLIDGLPTKGQQNNLIDTLYQKFVNMSPTHLRDIGITSGNIHRIPLGAKINLSAAFGNPSFVVEAYERAGGLTSAEISSIEADSASINNFMITHSRANLTEDIANRIIKERGH